MQGVTPLPRYPRSGSGILAVPFREAWKKQTRRVKRKARGEGYEFERFGPQEMENTAGEEVGGWHSVQNRDYYCHVTSIK
jgi:hypothetical protein